MELGRLMSLRGLFFLLSAGVAHPADLQGVIGGREAMGAADLRLERRDPWADELDHPAAGGADQVIVPLPGVDVLIKEPVAPETLLARQAALDQQVEVSVHGGAGDLERARLHRVEQLFRVDVTVLCEDLVEESEALRGDPMSPFPQELQEFLPLASV